MSLAGRSPSRQSLDHLPVILIVHPRSRQEFFSLALELGNLHATVQVTDEKLLVAPDGPVEEVLDRFGIPWEAQGAQRLLNQGSCGAGRVQYG